MITRFKILITLAILFIFNNLWSQTGAIGGIIKDAKTQETIIGANVVIAGTQTGSSSDLDGKFLIPKLNAGKYNIRITFISYKPIDLKDVVVEAGKVTNINVFMEDVTTNLQGVEIVAKKRNDTEISMVSMIKSSQLVVSGISNQQITRTQDRDAGEVIKRVPGINIIDNRFVVVRGLSERYNVVWLNNVSTPSSESDVKAFSFDNIPSSMLERIMIYKTPAPELPGDFGGGAVQIFTKNNPQKNTLDISFSTSYRPGSTGNDFYTIAGGKTDWLGYDDGTRALPDNFPGCTDMIELTNSLEQSDVALVNQLGRSLNKNWTTQKTTAIPDLRFSMALGFNTKIKKMNLGNVTTLNYSSTFTNYQIFRSDYQNYDTVNDLSDTSYFYNDQQYTNTVKIGAMNNWSLLVNKHTKIEFRNLFNQISYDRTTLRNGRDNYGGITIQAFENKFMSRSIYSGQLGGEHKYNDEATFIDWTLGYSYANRKEPDTKRLTMVLSEEDPDDPHYGSYAVQMSTAATPELTGRIYTDMGENIYNFTANFKQKIKIKNFKPELKAGVYFEKKDRQFNTRLIGYRIAKTSQFNWDLIYLPVDSLFLDTNINSTNGIKIDEKTNASDSYTADNQLIAAYISMKIPIFVSLNLYAGVRMEKNLQQLHSFQVDDPTKPVEVKLDTINFLPSFNLVYDVGERSLFRLAYGMTVNRPEFREIAPMLYYDFEKKAGIRGNPELKNAYIHNYDFRYELYPSLSEMITVGVFYKKFINPIELKVIPAGSGIDYTFDNADEAYDYGAEFEFKKTLDKFKDKQNFLKHLKDFNLLLNATYIKSMVKFAEGDLQVDRPLQGQSPYIVNAGFYWTNDSSGWMVSVMYNVIGKRIVYVGDPYTGNPDTYEMSRNLLDITIKKSIGKHWEIKGGVQDALANEVVYKQTITYTHVDLGEVSREQVLLKYKPTPYFTLGATYKF